MRNHSFRPRGHRVWILDCNPDLVSQTSLIWTILIKHRRPYRFVLYINKFIYNYYIYIQHAVCINCKQNGTIAIKCSIIFLYIYIYIYSYSFLFLFAKSIFGNTIQKPFLLNCKASIFNTKCYQIPMTNIPWEKQIIPFCFF